MPNRCEQCNKFVKASHINEYPQHIVTAVVRQAKASTGSTSYNVTLEDLYPNINLVLTKAEEKQIKARFRGNQANQVHKPASKLKISFDPFLKRNTGSLLAIGLGTGSIALIYGLAKYTGW